jgi:PAS domain S-box-containing protein
MVAAKTSSSTAFVKALGRALAPSSEAVTIADADGYILFANDEVERVYRRTKKSVLGKHPLTFCPKDFNPQFSKQIFENIQQKGRWNGVIMNVDAKGTRFPILLRTVLVDFVGLNYVVSWAKPFPASAPFELSGQQAQCFQLLGQGMTTKEVAGKLNISLSSVNTYLSRVKEAIEKAQSATDAKNREEIPIGLGHLAVCCHQAGWNPMMRIDTSIN